jgi:hypothetical protein
VAMIDKDLDGAARTVDQTVAANPKDAAVW